MPLQVPGTEADRYAIALLSNYKGHAKRAYLHSDIPPTRANRITDTDGEVLVAYEQADIAQGGQWFGSLDDPTPGAGTPEIMRVYARPDFRLANGKNPAVAANTRIRAVSFEYATLPFPTGDRSQEEAEKLPYATLAWAELDIAFPPPDGPGLVRFRLPGQLPAGSESFVAPYIETNIPSVVGRGGVALDLSADRGAASDILYRGADRDFWLLWLVQTNLLSRFAIRNADRLQCQLVFTDGTGRADAAADWPGVDFGLAAKFFLHGGDPVTALDFVNPDEIIVPAVDGDRPIPSHYQVRFARQRGRGVNPFRGLVLWWGALGACTTERETLPGGKEMVIAPETICASIWGRWQETDFVPEEPGQASGLRADVSKQGETVLTWGVLPGAHGWLVQVSATADFAALAYECHVFPREARLFDLAIQPWFCRVAGTNAAGRGPWSDTLQIVPGGRVGPEPPTPDGNSLSNLRVTETTQSTLTWAWDSIAGVEQCEVRWDGAASGSAAVLRTPGAGWTYTVYGLSPSETVALEVRQTAVGGGAPYGDWLAAVSGTTDASTSTLPGIRNLRVTAREMHAMDFAWEQDGEATPWTQIRTQYYTDEGALVDFIQQWRGKRTHRLFGLASQREVILTVWAAARFVSPNADGSYTWSSVDRSNPETIREFTLGVTVPPETPTNMQATATVGGVILKCERTATNPWTTFEWELTYAGETEHSDHERTVRGDTLIVPAPVGATVRARAWGASARDARLLSPLPSAWASATVAQAVPPPTNVRFVPISTGGYLRWDVPEGIEESRWEGAVRGESYAVNPASRIIQSLAGFPVLRGIGSAFVRGHPNWWLRVHVRSVAPSGLFSDWSDYVEVQVPGRLPVPEDLAITQEGDGDFLASWTAPANALPVVELDVTLEDPVGEVSEKTRINVQAGRVSAYIDRRRLLSKRATVRARYASIVLSNGRADGPFGQWTAPVSATLVIVAPTLVGTPSDRSIAVEITPQAGATSHRWRLQGEEDWNPISGHSFVVYDLAANTEYTVEVQAGNFAGWGPTAEGTWTTGADTGAERAPLAPSLTQVARTLTTMTVQVGAVAGATRYETRLGLEGHTFAATDGARRRQYIALAPGTEYTIEARALARGGTPSQVTSEKFSTARSSGQPTTPVPRPTLAYRVTQNGIFGTISAVAGATGYEWRYTRDDGTQTSWASANNQRMFTIGRLRPGTRYRVQVRAARGNDRSLERTYLITTAARTEGPPDPLVTSAPTATGAVVTISQTTGATQWRWRYQGTTAWTALSGRRFTIADRSAGTSYSIEVQAGDNATPVLWSNAVPHTFLTLPAAPTATLTPGSNSVSGTIDAVTGATSYEWRRGSGSWNSIPAGGRVFTDTGLTANSPYSYSVRARNASGPGAHNTYATRTTQGGLPAPTLSFDRITATSARLTIGAVAGATGYRWRFAGRQAWTTIGSGGRVATLSGLSGNTSYSVQAQALGAGGVEGGIGSGSFRTARPNPTGAPTLTRTSATPTSITCSISAVANATGYEWRISTDAPNTWRTARGRSFTATGLSPDTEYAFRARALPLPSTGRATTSGLFRFRTSARTLTAPAASFRTTASTINGTIARVDGATSYQYRVGTGSWLTIASGGRTFSVTGRAAGTKYSISVRATGGPPRTYADVWTKPAAPALTLSSPSASSIKVDLSAVTGATDYEARYRIGSGTWSGWTRTGTDRTHTFTGLTANTLYTLEARAIGTADSAGNAAGAAAAKQQRTQQAGLAAPTGGLLKARNTFLRIWISAVAGAPVYQYRYKKSGTTSWSDWASTPAPSRQDTITGLTANTTYNIEVQACKTGGTECSPAYAFNAKTSTLVGLPSGVRLSKYRYPGPAIFRPDHYGLRLDFDLPADCHAIDIQLADNRRYRAASGLLGAIIDILNFLPVTTWVGVVGQVLTQANRALGLDLDPFGSGAPGLTGVARFKGFTGSGPYFITWPLGQDNPAMWVRFRAVRGNGDDLDADTSALVERNA